MQTTKNTIKAANRDKLGTKYTRRARENGQLPAILYGHGQTPEPVTLSAHDVSVELAHGTRVLQIELDGSIKQYLIKAVQYDYLGTHPIHLDLVRVDLDERVTVMVGLELRGIPKGVADGGVLDQNLAKIEIECLVNQIPDTLRPSVTHLGVGESLLVRDLKLPEGVTTTADPDERVATVTVLAEEVEEVAAEGKEEKEVQPEIIGKGKKEEEEKEKEKEKGKGKEKD